MSNIYSHKHSEWKQNASDIEIFVSDDNNENTFTKAEELLADIPHGLEKAIGSTIKRAGISGEAHAAKAVRDYYYIKAQDFKEFTKRKRHISTSAGQTSVTIDFRGWHIPLIRFKTRIDKSGKVIANVQKSSPANVLEHVFKQQMGPHIGLYERVGVERYPVVEKFGPSPVQMMFSNEKVLDEIVEKVEETFNKRIDHEILAVLNGWHK